MNYLVSAKHVNKSFEKKIVLNDVNFMIPEGRVVGLIGPNGAGKTTLLKGILGLSPVEGELRVMNIDPHKERENLLQNVSFIADTAILPRWMRVQEAVDYVEGVHPKFSREKCVSFLAKTSIQPKSKIKDLSKGMVTQLHLALIMAIDSKLLVLDEPTLGLDIIYRKQFYQSLLNDYYDAQKTVLITTHQVEEIEDILTDVIFINQGKILLDESMESISERFVEVVVDEAHKKAAVELKPIHARNLLGAYSFIFENVDAAQLSELGKCVTPKLADLFVAKIQPTIML